MSVDEAQIIDAIKERLAALTGRIDRIEHAVSMAHAPEDIAFLLAMVETLEAALNREPWHVVGRYGDEGTCLWCGAHRCDDGGIHAEGCEWMRLSPHPDAVAQQSSTTAAKAKSARPCGCDSGEGWVCEWHR